MTFRVSDEMLERAVKAIYPLLQDIINNRPLKNKLDMPEFQLARAALEAALRPSESPLPEGYEMFEGKPMKVINGDRVGWWRFHDHYDRDGYCDNPGRGY